MELTFHGVTSKELWELMTTVKMRINRLESMMVSPVYVDEEKVEFEKELNIQRMWENRTMSAYIRMEREERFAQ